MASTALLLALALAAETQIDAGIRVEAQARRDDPPAVAGERRAVDLTALPRLALHVREGWLALDTTYSPRFSALALGPHSRREQVHEGEVRLRLSRGPMFRLETFASGARGRSDLLTQSIAGGPGGGAVTTTLSTRSVDFERARAGASLSAALDGRTELNLAGSLSQDGGTDAASRATYPRARVLSGSGELGWDVTRLDRLGLLLSADQTRIAQLRSDSLSTSAQATWRRRLTRRSELRSSAGAVVLVSRLPDAGSSSRATHTLLQPAAQLGWALTGEPMHVTGDLAATLGATVDRNTGQAVRRGEARASLTWPWSRYVAAVGRGSGGLSWSDAGRIETSQLALGLAFTLTPRVHLELRGTGAWQRSTDPAAGDLDSYGAVLSLSLDAPPLRF